MQFTDQLQTINLQSQLRGQQPQWHHSCTCIDCYVRYSIACSSVKVVLFGLPRLGCLESR
jgi:hypothetical protein